MFFILVVYFVCFVVPVIVLYGVEAYYNGYFLLFIVYQFIGMLIGALSYLFGYSIASLIRIMYNRRNK